MKIRTQLIVTYIVIALLPVLLVSWTAYSKARSALVKEQQNSLESTTELKIDSIQSYFSFFSKEITITKERFTIRQYFPILVGSENKINTSEQKRVAEVIDMEAKSILSTIKEIKDLFLIDSNGKIVYSSKKETEQKNIRVVFPVRGLDAFLKGKEGVFLSDILYDKNLNERNFLESAPIYDLSGNFAGVLIFQIDAESLFSVVQETIGMGNTGETLIARQVSEDPLIPNNEKTYDPQGKMIMFLNPLRFDQNASFNRFIRIGDKTGLPIQNAIQKKDGGGINIDYRGKEVLSVWKYLPEYHWSLVTKIDMSEVLSPVYEWLKTAVMVFFAIILFIILFSILLAHILLSPIKEIMSVVKEFREGNKAIRLSRKIISSKNEIGEFGRILESYADEVLCSEENTKKQIEEKTQKLAKQEEEMKTKLENVERANKLMVGRELEMVKLKKEIAEYKNSKQ
ncbi:MAG: cache domain-containing protein [Candidatus Parcubacteria bacterium]|nr:cache domain-containing protein [Candidatus Parcubacteria bacterium]